MLSYRRTTLALLASLAALALGACGGDDEESADTTPPKAAQTQTTPTTDTGSTGSAGDPKNNPRAKEIVACLGEKGMFTIVNPGTSVGADYHLVIDNGTGGIIYGFEDEATAKASKGKVDKDQGSAGRETEVIGDVTYSTFPKGDEFAAPEKTPKARACARG